MSYKFRAGQSVLFTPRFNTASARGVFKVIRALPVENDDRVRYRIKSAAESFERIAEEYELTSE